TIAYAGDVAISSGFSYTSTGIGVIGGNGTINNIVRIRANTNVAGTELGGAISPGDPLVNGGIGEITVKSLLVEGKDSASTAGAGRVILQIASPDTFDQITVSTAVNLNSNNEEIGSQLDL